VSRHGLMAMASSLDQIGPFTKTVEDTAIVLSRIAGEDAWDATSAESGDKRYEAYLTGDIRGVRIGIPDEYFSDALDPKVREVAEKAIEKFKSLGAIVERISLPHSKYALPTYYIIMPAEVSSNLARLDGIRYGMHVNNQQESVLKGGALLEGYLDTRQYGFGDEVKRRIMLGTYTLSAGYYDAYYLKAQKVRALIRKDFEEAFGKVDLIFSPTCPEAAFKFGSKTEDPIKMYLSDIYTVTANMAGVPAISFPMGTIEEDGKRLPLGGQLMAKWFDEEGLLCAADAFEKAAG
jgi:aspartyl-tRNA(Asn)/glutamyl-tRNA(Gln) amidotransferase subunit A